MESALGVYEFGQANSAMHLASIYRVHTAIAHETGRVDDAVRYRNTQLETLGLWQTPQGDVLKESGLLDQTPDIIPPSWTPSEPPGVFVVLPFRSICSFGYKLYSNVQDEKDEKYLQYLHQAEICFSTALADCKMATKQTARMTSR